MALQASGAISLDNIRTEFGGDAPHSLSEYYRGGTYVGANNTTVPTSGAIDFADFYSTTAAMVLNITSNATEQNIKTLAVAAGLTDGSGVPLIVNISAVLTGSSTHALQTGDLDNSHDITININSGGELNGFTGSLGSNSAGGTGGDALFWNVDSGGSATYIVNLSGGKLRSGGGGGGGGGHYGRHNTLYYDKGSSWCDTPAIYGSYGADGTAGGYGQAGTAGAAGTLGGGNAMCLVYNPGAGYAGGAAGHALRKNGHTVTFNNNSGTLAGTVG